MNFQSFFEPESVVIIGASREPGSVGNNLLMNVIDGGYKGKIYPVNPKADEILGVQTFHSVSEIPDKADLALFAIPARFVPGTIRDCAEKGIKSVVIITAGFKEAGPEGAKLEGQLLEELRKYDVHAIGPNCVGVVMPRISLNATFVSCETLPKPGNIAFFSQSGALCAAVLDWAASEGIGFSRFFSLGNNVDLNEVDILYALAEDPETSVILGYIEGIKEGRKFLEAARTISKTKPIIAVKSGGTESGARAASSHTGSLAGSAKAFDAVFTQSGLIRAMTIEELFDFAIAFAQQPLPQGPGLVIVTNSGGPGVMAADAIEHTSVRLANLGKDTVDSLREKLPKHAAFYNPVDIIGDSGPDRYADALRISGKDDNADGVLAILTPTGMSRAIDVAKTISDVSDESDTTVLASFLGGGLVAGARKIMRERGVPHYTNPERAVMAFDAMYRYNMWTRKPINEPKAFDVDRGAVEAIFKKAKENDLLQLGELECREVISAYGFKLPASVLAQTDKQVLRIADNVGYPLVMKIMSPEILHKSDFGGVKLNINSGEEALTAYHELRTRTRRLMPDAYIRGVAVQEMILGGKEVILGMTRDPQFGPMMMFGLGGIYVEVLKDVSFRIAPISEDDAYEMVREIRSYPLLAGVRGEKPADIDGIVDSLLRLSQLVMDFPEIVELDVNPLKVFPKGEGVIALDARLTLGGDKI